MSRSYRCHLDTKRLERVDDFAHIGDNRIFFVGKFGKIVLLEFPVRIELDSLGVN